MEKLTKYFDFFCLLGDSKRHRYDEELRQIFIEKKFFEYFINEYETIPLLRPVFSSCSEHSFINPFLIALLGLAKIEKPTLCEEFVKEIDKEVVEPITEYNDYRYTIEVDYERLLNYTNYEKICDIMVNAIYDNGIDVDYFYEFEGLCWEIIERVYFDKETGKICLKMDNLTFPGRFALSLVWSSEDFLYDMVNECIKELKSDLKYDTERYYKWLEAGYCPKCDAIIFPKSAYELVCPVCGTPLKRIEE
ncbi:MAG: hypothetical protein LWW95_08170 [Candidatus Desulfofervidus auxilii]|nr:hypothetical protein [Candidatus Desulfofervidus auxilii]